MPDFGSPHEPQADTEWLSFRPSGIHGLGAFARRYIPSGTRVVEYIGEKITKQESLRRCEANNEYIFALDEQHDIDGSVRHNPARLINHSCSPNCEAVIEDGRVWILTTRPISSGEEITFNYGFDLADYREYPCHCGAPDCVGYMVAEELREHVRSQREAAT